MMNPSDGEILLCPLVVLPRRQRGQVVWALHLKSGDPEFRSCPDHYLDSPPRLCLEKANWSASCQMYSVFGFIDPEKPHCGEVN